MSSTQSQPATADAKQTATSNGVLRSISADVQTQNASAGLPTPKLVLLPTRYIKTIYLVRHGEGFHNVAGHADHDNYKSEEWFDAHLTEKGWQQAEALNRHIREAGIKVDVVVVAPLTRALETAVGAFGDFSSQQQQGAQQAAGGDQPPLMAAQQEVAGHRVGRAAVSAEGLPPFVAYELCREQIGVHPCDRRRPTAHYRSTFPAVDFSLVSEEDDAYWTQANRETHEEVRRRGMLFMEWLSRRPERSICVVTHSSFLYHMLTNFGHGEGEALQGELHRWFDNCEMRSIVLADSFAANAPPDGLHFTGGKQGLAA